MDREVIPYFMEYAKTLGSSKGEIYRAANELRRAGITDMDTLCGLLQHSPEKVRGFRDIGEKRFRLVEQVCTVYMKHKVP